MLANQISKHRDIYCTPDTPLPELFQLMIGKNCSCVAIVESLAHKNIIGVVTEHDICLKTITAGLNPQRISAGRVMNGNITTICENANIDECVEIMKRENTQRLFVIDDNGAFCGIVTEAELITETITVSLEKIFSDLTVLPALKQELRFAF